MSPMTVDTHVKRAARHRTVGDALSVDEWSAVCYFYSAFHLMRAALLQDPIFRSPTISQQVHSDLLPDDKYTERHKGRGRRKGGEPKEWGVNELALRLYGRPVGSAYERLHVASLDVRYGDGFVGAIADLQADLQFLEDARAAGNLVARHQTTWAVAAHQVHPPTVS